MCELQGVTVVTQLIPQVVTPEEVAVDLHGAASLLAAQSPGAEAPDAATINEMRVQLQLQGTLEILGLAQILLGSMSSLFSVAALLTPFLLIHRYFSIAALFVVSGSVALATSKWESNGLAWASLLSNVTASVLALGGLTFVSWLLADPPTPHDFPSVGVNILLFGTRGFVLILLMMLLFCSIAVCLTTWKVVRCRGCRRHYKPVVVQNVPVSKT